MDDLSDRRPPGSGPSGPRRWDRRRAYLALIGTCLGLVVLAWGPVKHWSLPLAVAMSVVAAVIPPIAAVVGNSGVLTGRDPLDFEER